MIQHTRVQFGCGLCAPDGWLNFDSTPTLWVARLPLSRTMAAVIQRAAQAQPGNHLHLMLANLRNTRARYGDITRGLPLPNGSVQQLYASHVIEHLPLNATRDALQECRRLLAPDGLFRLVVPNLRYLAKRYLDAVNHQDDRHAAIQFCLESGMGSSSWGPVWSRLRGDRHHLMHDVASLTLLLEEAGFSNVRQAHFGDSQLDFSAVEDPERWREPDNIGLECSG